MFNHKAGKRRILVVDDEPHIGTFLASGLGGEGFDVKVSSGVVDALHLMGWGPLGSHANKWRPDLLIADWKMPSYDGTELLYLLRSDPVSADLPVILMGHRSPLYDSAAYLEALPWRAEAYIFKPFSIRDLLPLVSSIFDKPKE